MYTLAYLKKCLVFKIRIKYQSAIVLRPNYITQETPRVTYLPAWLVSPGHAVIPAFSDSIDPSRSFISASMRCTCATYCGIQT